MNPKKLAMIFYGFIAAMLVLALILFNFQQRPAEKQHLSEKANVISRVDTFKSTETQSKTPHKVVDLKSIQEKSPKLETVDSDSNSLTYLAVYQQLQTARVCKYFYRIWRQNSLEIDMSNSVGRPLYIYGETVYPGTEKVPLTPEQNDSLEHWVAQCYQLWQDYGVFDKEKTNAIPLNDITEAISTKLLSITPRTGKEQKLKNTRQLAEQWTVSYQTLEKAYEGDDSLEPTAAQALYDELTALQELDEEVKNQWFDAQRNNQPDSESLRDQHFDLLRQIKALENRIKEQKKINPDKLEQAILNFQSFDQAMNQTLRTKDADVFFEVVYTYNGKRAFVFNYLGFEHHSTYSKPADKHRITPDQLVFESSGRINSSMNHGELRYAYHLYLCELGWDCGPQSPIVMNYCLIGIFGSYPDACGKDLFEFYREHLISPNRWQDVMVFKSLYKELFYE